MTVVVLCTANPQSLPLVLETRVMGWLWNAIPEATLLYLILIIGFLIEDFLSSVSDLPPFLTSPLILAVGLGMVKTFELLP